MSALNDGKRPGWARELTVAVLVCGMQAAAMAQEAGTTDSPPDEDKVEGAIGLLVRNAPAYMGSSDRVTKPNLGGFLRWGRITVTGAGGFTTKRKDDVERGLAAELARRGKLRLSLTLRYDQGRSESDTPQLAGLGDIRNTVRARMVARWDPVPDWHVSAGVSVDALNRGGGYFADAGLSHDWDLGHGQRLIASGSVTGAGDRYMQAWYGVSPAQAVASSYPEFKAGEGLRDLQLSLTWRIEFAKRWAGFLGATHTEMLGSARRSPLTHDPSAQSINGGLAWRF